MLHIETIDFATYHWCCQLCSEHGATSSDIEAAAAVIAHQREKHQPALTVNPYPSWDDVDDAVDRWHEGAGLGMELYEYLGWTDEEYSAWVSDPKKIRPLRIWPS